MKTGGIFSKKALGALGAADIDCTGTSIFTAVKAALVAKGYTGLMAKTSWDGCFASVIMKELGHPLATVGDVKTLTGGGCVTGYVDMGLGDLNPLIAGAGPIDLPSCSDGSDGKGTLPVKVDPSGPLSTTCITDCGKLPFLSADWQNCVTKCGGNILQPPPPTQGTPTCQAGMFYDSGAQSCMLILDPLNCGPKCSQYTAWSPEWVKCMVNCGAKAVGPGGNVVTVPGTNPPVQGSGMSMADVFGKNWLLIAAALAVGIGYVVYRNEQKKKKQRLGMPATPNRRRRRHHRRH